MSRTDIGGGFGDVWCDRCREFLGTGAYADVGLDYCPSLEDCVSHLGDKVNDLETRLADMEAKVLRAATTVRTAFAGARTRSSEERDGQ